MPARRSLRRIDRAAPSVRGGARRLAAAGLVLAGLAGLAASPGVRAAIDNVNMPPPVFVPAAVPPEPATPAASAASAGTPAKPAPAERGLLAAGKRLIRKVTAAGQRVVDSVQQRVASTDTDAGWRAAAARPAPEPAPPPAPPVPTAAEIAARGIAAATAPSLYASAADVSSGMRLHVLQGDADTHVPNVAWMADVLPASADSLTRSTLLRPSLHVSAEWALPNDFSLGLMPGMAVNVDPTGRKIATGTVAVTLGKAWSPQWRTFLDMARDRLAVEQVGGTATTVDAGVTYLASPGVQLDVAVTHGLSPTAPPFQAGVGVSSSF